MDEHNRLPEAPQPANQAPISSSTPANTNTTQPKTIMSDGEAQALLAINNLQAAQQPKNKPPLKILIVAAVVVVLAVLASYLLGAYKDGGKTSDLGIPNQSNPSSTSGVNNQINQDVKTCSNPLNASLVC